jgi:hypothetical protein
MTLPLLLTSLISALHGIERSPSCFGRFIPKANNLSITAYKMDITANLLGPSNFGSYRFNVTSAALRMNIKEKFTTFLKERLIVQNNYDHKIEISQRW